MRHDEFDDPYYDEDRYDYADEDDDERAEGCCFPGRCLMPDFHFKDECYTVEMIRDWERECNPKSWRNRTRALREWWGRVRWRLLTFVTPSRKQQRCDGSLLPKGHPGDCDDLPF